MMTLDSHNIPLQSSGQPNEFINKVLAIVIPEVVARRRLNDLIGCCTSKSISIVPSIIGIQFWMRKLTGVLDVLL